MSWGCLHLHLSACSGGELSQLGAELAITVQVLSVAHIITLIVFQGDTFNPSVSLAILLAGEALFFKFYWDHFPGLLVVQQLNSVWVKWKFILLHHPQQLSSNSCFRQEGKVVTASKWAKSKSQEIEYLTGGVDTISFQESP